MREPGYYWVRQKSSEEWMIATYKPAEQWCWNTLETRYACTETEFHQKFTLGERITHPNDAPTPFVLSASNFSDEFIAKVKQELQDHSGSVIPDDTIVATTSRSIEKLRAEKNQAYLERNYLVVALAWAAIAQGWIAGRWFKPDEEEGWGWMVHIQLPTGRADWHFPEEQFYLIEQLPVGNVEWEDYSTEEKYKRVMSVQFQSLHRNQ